MTAQLSLLDLPMGHAPAGEASAPSARPGVSPPLADDFEAPTQVGSPDQGDGRRAHDAGSALPAAQKWRVYFSGCVVHEAPTADEACAAVAEANGVKPADCLALPYRERGDGTDLCTRIQDGLELANTRAGHELEQLRALHAEIEGCSVDELDARLAARKAEEASVRAAARAQRAQVSRKEAPHAPRRARKGQTTAPSAATAGENLDDGPARGVELPAAGALPPEMLTQRLWARVNKDGPVPAHRPELGPCWLWTGATDREGYGQINFRGRRWGTHRIALASTSSTFDEALEVLHECDTPLCCNPAHLRAGTHAENLGDMAARGRAASGDRSGARRHPERLPRGRQHHAAKLNEEQVLVIRAAHARGESSAAICARLGIDASPRTIRDVIAGKQWAHVSGSAAAAPPTRKLSTRERQLLAMLRLDGQRAIYADSERIPDWHLLKRAVLTLGGKPAGGSAFRFPDDVDAAEAVRLALETGEILDLAAAGFFETPDALADHVVALAELRPGARVLEPSAGRGRIARAIRRACASAHVECVELIEENAKALLADGFRVFRGDFLSVGAAHHEPFDAICANPPFANRADIIHVRHMLGFLKPGGRLVAIASAGVKYRDDALGRAFRDELAQHGAVIEGNPPGSFAESGTMVNTVTISLTKGGRR